MSVEKGIETTSTSLSLSIKKPVKNYFSTGFL